MLRSTVYTLSAAFIALVVLDARPAVAELIIRFDYSLDTQGFFSDPARRARLEQATALYRFADVLAPIAPSQSDHWSVRLVHPGEPSFPTVSDLAVPADTVVIFPGGRPLAGALGFANAATVLDRTGSADFVDAVDTRSQSGAAGTPLVDFGPTVGTITFNTLAPWHFGESTDGLDGTRQDFLTTAAHEIAHLLGIGEAPSWGSYVVETENGFEFHGPASNAAYGGPVPLDPFASHFAEGVSSFVGGIVQEAMMDPSTPRGVRQLPTVLDMAALADIRWTPVPEPSGLTLAGMGAVLVLAAKQRRIARLSSRRIAATTAAGP